MYPKKQNKSSLESIDKIGNKISKKSPYEQIKRQPIKY